MELCATRAHRFSGAVIKTDDINLNTDDINLNTDDININTDDININTDDGPMKHVTYNVTWLPSWNKIFLLLVLDCY